MLELSQGTPDVRLETAWEELAEATAATPWVRPGWLVPWWRWMGRGTPLLLLQRSSRGDLQAVLPLQRARSGLASPTNWHTPSFSVVAAGPQARQELLRGALELAGPRLSLDFIDAALAADLTTAASSRGGRSFTRALEVSPYLELPGDCTQLESSWDSHLLSDLRRRSRRLQERGELQFEVRDGAAGLSTLLEEGFRVEASGWKGERGTAISSTATTLGFYRAVARSAAAKGELRLHLLRLDGVAIGFDLAVEHAGVHYLLKTGYDEQYRASGVGKFLRAEALRDCSRRGVRRYEFLGDVADWKRTWTTTTHTRLQAIAFAPTVSGTVGWAVHAHAKPAARTARNRLAKHRGG